MGHGHTAGGKRSPTYVSWQAAIARTSYPSHPFYPLYGGRGIRVCESWRGPGGFGRFLDHLGPRPVGTTLDRIDPDGDYTPGNVRWATPRMQRWNQRDMAVARQTLQLDGLEVVETPPQPEMPF